MVTDNKWRCIKDILAPARGSGVWSFCAVPPSSSDSHCFILHLGEEANIIITPWRRVPPKSCTLSLRAPSGWRTVDRAKDDDDEPKKGKGPDPLVTLPRQDTEASLPENDRSHVPPTVLDTGTTQDDADMNKDSSENAGQKRSPGSPNKETPKPKAKQCSSGAELSPRPRPHCCRPRRSHCLGPRRRGPHFQLNCIGRTESCSQSLGDPAGVALLSYTARHKRWCCTALGLQFAAWYSATWRRPSWASCTSQLR